MGVDERCWQVYVVGIDRMEVDGWLQSITC